MIQWHIIFERLVGFLKSLTSAQILEFLKILSLCWVCLIWPALYCISVISDEYLGNDNLFEQIVEAFNKIATGANVDISHEANMSSEPNDLKKYIPNER